MTTTKKLGINQLYSLLFPHPGPQTAFITSSNVYTKQQILVIHYFFILSVVDRNTERHIGIDQG